MSGRGYAERNLLSFFVNSFSPLDLFKADFEAEELIQGLHLVSLVKDTGLEKDSPALSAPRVCCEPPTSFTAEAGLLQRISQMQGLFKKCRNFRLKGDGRSGP